jgi:hypothetical protein
LNGAPLLPRPLEYDVEQVTGHSESIISKRTYRLPDHSLVIFGYESYSEHRVAKRRFESQGGVSL